MGHDLQSKLTSGSFKWARRHHPNRNCCQERKCSQKSKFGAGYPVDVHAHIPVDVRGKNFVQAFEVPEKRHAFRCGRPRPEGAESRTSMTMTPWGFKNFGQKSFGLNFRFLQLHFRIPGFEMFSSCDSNSKG